MLYDAAGLLPGIVHSVPQCVKACTTSWDVVAETKEKEKEKLGVVKMGASLLLLAMGSAMAPQ